MELILHFCAIRCFLGLKEREKRGLIKFPLRVANFNQREKMAEEAAVSEITSPPVEQNQNSVNATIESGAQGGTESTCNNINNSNNAESSVVTSDGDREKSLEYAHELMVKGSKASKDEDYGEAVECYSRALEIRLGFTCFISSPFFLISRIFSCFYGSKLFD